MAKLMPLAFIFSTVTLIQYSYCKHEKRPTYLTILGVNVDLALDSIKNYVYGAPGDKDLIDYEKQIEHMDTRRDLFFVAKDVAIAAKNAPELTILSETLQKLLALLNVIDDVFRQYELLEGLKKSAIDDQVYQFAKNSTSRHSGPLADILKMYSAAIPPDSKKGSNNDYSRKILPLLINEMKGYQRLCGTYVSQQLMFQAILDNIVIAELKVFLVTEFAIRKLAERDKMDYKSKVDKLKNDLHERIQELTTNFHRYMTRASREIWQCDPDHYIEGDTYFKMNIPPLFESRDDEATEYYYSIVDDGFHPCQGQHSDSDEEWTDPEDENSAGIHEVLEEGSPDNRNEASPTRYAGPKINLRPVTADKDHVITGIRWIEEDNTLHLQIQQGKVLARGKVNEWTVDWKNIKGPRDENDTSYISLEGLRGFLLKDIVLPKDRVVVGVKLEIVKIKHVKLLTLRLLGATYKYETGRLIYRLPFYEDPDNSVAQGLWNSSIKLPGRLYDDEIAHPLEVKLPKSTEQPSIPVDITKTYFLITTLNFQTFVDHNIILFFDMQENIVSPAFPLSGLGIYFKKTDDYFGFLALKLLTFDHTHYIA